MIQSLPNMEAKRPRSCRTHVHRTWGFWCLRVQFFGSSNSGRLPGTSATQTATARGKKWFFSFFFSKYRRGYSRELFLTSPSPDNKWMRIEHGCLKGQLGCVVVQTHSGNLLFNSGSERRKSKVLNNFSRFPLRFQGALREGGKRRTTTTQLCIFCLFVKFRANVGKEKKGRRSLPRNCWTFPSVVVYNQNPPG